jgi:hypothetical protein
MVKKIYLEILTDEHAFSIAEHEKMVLMFLLFACMYASLARGLLD